MSRVLHSSSKTAINQHSATTTKPLEANGPENSHSVSRSTIQRLKKSKNWNANKNASCATAEWKFWRQATNPKPQAIKAPGTPSLQLCIIMNKLHGGGVTPLSSWTPRAAKKNLLLVICITKMGQNFINFFSWVDIHDIYYIVKTGNQNWGSMFFIKHTVPN